MKRSKFSTEYHVLATAAPDGDLFDLYLNLQQPEFVRDLQWIADDSGTMYAVNSLEQLADLTQAIQEELDIRMPGR